MLNKGFFKTFLGFTAIVLAGIVVFLVVAGWNTGIIGSSNTQETAGVDTTIHSE
ncbi:hypothetical protein ACFLY0_00355 [Patescibacteria group bacterium]